MVVSRGSAIMRIHPGNTARIILLCQGTTDSCTGDEIPPIKEGGHPLLSELTLTDTMPFEGNDVAFTMTKGLDRLELELDP